MLDSGSIYIFLNFSHLISNTIHFDINTNKYLSNTHIKLYNLDLNPFSGKGFTFFYNFLLKVSWQENQKTTLICDYTKPTMASVSI